MAGWLKRFVFAGLALVIIGIVPASAAKVVIIINKVSQKMTVEVDGDVEYRWPISTGAPGYDTPSGKYKPFRMEKEHFSKEWDDAPMPYSIFFTSRGHAVHGSYHTKSLGRRASHGCVRLHPDNAAKLFSLVKANGMSNTQVVVKGGLFEGGFSTKDVRREVKKVKKKVTQRCTLKNGKKTCKKGFFFFSGL
jgi:lipoprotein-anchoring transpeptidase ErfK/SrfK